MSQTSRPQRPGRPYLPLALLCAALALHGTARAQTPPAIQIVTNLGHAGTTAVGCNYISSAVCPNLPFPVR